MFVLGTDTLSHLLRVHARVVERRSQVTEDVVLTTVTRIEVAQDPRLRPRRRPPPHQQQGKATHPVHRATSSA